MGKSGIFDCVSAYPLHNILRSLRGEEWYFRLRIRVSAYPLHNILRSLRGEEWYFRLRIRVSAYPLHNIPRSLLGEEWYFPLCIRVSAYPLYNIPRSLLREEWYFRLRIRVSAYPLHNILLRSLLGEGCYFRLRIRVSNLFRSAASKWRGILQLLQFSATKSLALFSDPTPATSLPSLTHSLVSSSLRCFETHPLQETLLRSLLFSFSL